MDYRNGKIAGQIIALQNEDGTWGMSFIHYQFQTIKNH